MKGCGIAVRLTCTGLLMALCAGPVLAQFPDPSFADVLNRAVAQAEAGTYEPGSFPAYWRQRLGPVWGDLPEQQQRFYLLIFKHYDMALSYRARREWTKQELRDVLRYSLDPTQEPAALERNMQQLKEHFRREKDRSLKGKGR
jgi:hypothetical protein